MKKRSTPTGNSSPSRHRPAEADEAGTGGQAEDGSKHGLPAPSLPHDRDEKPGMTGGVQSHVVQQGARDLKRGVQDTSRAPEADAAYKKLKR